MDDNPRIRGQRQSSVFLLSDVSGCVNVAVNRVQNVIHIVNQVLRIQAERGASPVVIQIRAHYTSGEASCGWSQKRERSLDSRFFWEFGKQSF